MTRSIFEPEDGEIFERQDESQIEYRLLVHFAALTKDYRTQDYLEGAPQARDAYVNNPATDFHKFAAELIGINPEDKILRKRVKNINFCRVYMGGDEKIAHTAGIPLAEAKKFGREYDKHLPFVRRLGVIAMERADEVGFVRTLLGRRQRFTLYEPKQLPKGVSKADRKKLMALYDTAVERYGAENIKRGFTHAALNRILQGSAADVLKKALKDTWESGVCKVLGAPLITVHDENDWSIPRTKEGEEAALEARHIMENTVKLCLPLKVEAERGSNWGDVV
jgi:DNA polymerase-1